jgi:hypothetical protein
MPAQFKILVLWFTSNICLSSGLAQQGQTKDQALDEQVTFCLRQMMEWQASAPKGMYAGLLPVFRVNATKGAEPKVDNSAFFTGLTINILREYYPRFSAANKGLADDIIRNALPAIARFKHQQQKPTYFFWPADTPVYFPNSLLGKVAPKKRYIPDDADDTVILLQATAASDSSLKAAHRYFQQFVANDQYPAKGTMPEYRQYGAYSTWLGRGMPVDFDLCVHANILHFADKHGLPWTAADTASAALIVNIIKNGHHLTKAGLVSPHYGRPALLIYHLAKWMQVNRNGWLLPLRSQLIRDAENLLLKADSPLEKLLLQITLLRLGVNTSIPPATFDESALEQDNYAFFRANISAYLDADTRKKLDHWKLITFNFYCPAFNYAILLQYCMESAFFTAKPQ